MRITEEDLKPKTEEAPVSPEPQKDPEREAVKKTLSGEKKKLSTMTGREKLAYIWEYYHLAILGVFFALLFGFYLLYAQLTNKETRLFGIAINLVTGDPDPVLEELAPRLNLNPKKEEIHLNTGYYLSGTEIGTATGGSAEQVFTAFVAARDLDFVLVNEAALQYVATGGATADLSTFLPAELYQQLSDTFTIREVRSLVSSLAQVQGENKDNYISYPGAIKISDTAFAKKLGIISDDAWLCLIKNSEETDNLIVLLTYMLELEHS